MLMVFSVCRATIELVFVRMLDMRFSFTVGALHHGCSIGSSSVTARDYALLMPCGPLHRVGRAVSVDAMKPSRGGS